MVTLFVKSVLGRRRSVQLCAAFCCTRKSDTKNLIETFLIFVNLYTYTEVIIAIWVSKLYICDYYANIAMI